MYVDGKRLDNDSGRGRNHEYFSVLSAWNDSMSKQALLDLLPVCAAGNMQLSGRSELQKGS